MFLYIIQFLQFYIHNLYYIHLYLSSSPPSITLFYIFLFTRNCILYLFVLIKLTSLKVIQCLKSIQFSSTTHSRPPIIHHTLPLPLPTLPLPLHPHTKHILRPLGHLLLLLPPHGSLIWSIQQEIPLILYVWGRMSIFEL